MGAALISKLFTNPAFTPGPGFDQYAREHGIPRRPTAVGRPIKQAENKPAAPPMGLMFSSADPLQQRTQIATQALSGNRAYAAPDALKYYLSLLEGSLFSAGNYAPYSSIQPIEHQFTGSVLGQPSYQPTTQSFLEAVRRGTASL